jgi:hypothetical protein
MSRQYNLQFTDPQSRVTFSGVMTVDTATKIITDLYELSDPTMKNLVNSVNDPGVSSVTHEIPYKFEDDPGYNPNDTTMYTEYTFKHGVLSTDFTNVFDISYGTNFDNFGPFGVSGVWLNSLGSEMDAYYKDNIINSGYFEPGVIINSFGYIINSFIGIPYGGDGTFATTSYLQLSDISITPFNVSCFTRNTKITTADGEVAIQNIRMGTFIPTLSSGLKEVVEIGVRNIKTFPDIEDVGLQIYRYEDGLRVTGKHSVLVDELTEEEQILIPSIIGCLKQTEGKWLLPACIDPYAEQLEASGMFTVYHLVLENDDDDANYGIVAHNTWVETCSKNDFDRYVK